MKHVVELILHLIFVAVENSNKKVRKVLLYCNVIVMNSRCSSKFCLRTIP